MMMVVMLVTAAEGFFGIDIWNSPVVIIIIISIMTMTMTMTMAMTKTMINDDDDDDKYAGSWYPVWFDRADNLPCHWTYHCRLSHAQVILMIMIMMFNYRIMMIVNIGIYYFCSTLPACMTTDRPCYDHDYHRKQCNNCHGHDH